MSIKVKIAPLLQEYADIPDTVEVSGNTVGQCLDDLVKQYPESSNWLFDQNSLLKVLVSINDVEMVTFDKEGLNKILKTNDELHVIAVISGG
ncbi:MAG TPA: MoaD/ThiS family protein [Dehalococcoidales bacterium]